MPLMKSGSKKAFEKNLKTELEAGKPKDQSLAIAYHVKRKAAHKMAKGGQPKLGSGKRFEKLEHSISHEKGVHDAGAIAASIGRKKYGEKKMNALAHHKKMYQGGAIDADSEDQDELGMLHGDESFGHNEVDVSANEEGMPDADSKTSEELDMLRRKKMARGGEVPNFHDESEPNADRDNTAHSETMLRGARTEHSAEKNWAKSMPTIDSNDEDDSRDEDMLAGKPIRHHDEVKWASDRPNVDSDDDGDDHMDTDMVSQIMEKRKSSEDMNDNPTLQEAMTGRSRYARGGEVDLQDNNGDEHLNKEDQLSFDAARKDTYYDDDQLEDQPEDSNEHGDELSDEDSHDMVGMIRKKMKMRKVGQ